jgi:multidrug resistance efflux pump
MRSCGLSLILLVLVVANGYALWEIHQIRAILTEVRADVHQSRRLDRDSMADVARDAAEAIGRGELDRAQADLERFGELLEQTGQMADQQRQRLIRQLEKTRESIAQGSSRANEEIGNLVRMLSLGGEQESPDSE